MRIISTEVISLIRWTFHLKIPFPQHEYIYENEKKKRKTTGYHKPIHDKSISEKHKDISGDLNRIQQSLTKKRGTMVKN